jgi:hypothetical protein
MKETLKSLKARIKELEADRDARNKMTIGQLLDDALEALRDDLEKKIDGVEMRFDDIHVSV